MTTPDRIRPRSLVTAGRKPLIVRTASGQLATPKPGERITLDDAKRLVDVVFAFDTTGSMSSKLQGLQNCMAEFIQEIVKFLLDWQFSLVPFGDLTVPGDKIVDNLPFVNDAEAAIRMIRSAPHFSGGSNTGESSLEAMQAAMFKPYRKGAVKVIVLLTDEPPLTSRQLTTEVINLQLQQREFICFVASPSGHGYEALAHDNGGKWYPIGSSLNTADLLQFLRQLLKNVSRVSNDVHRLGWGSVARYLANPDRKVLE
ncbi:VWA domain-containing protein [Candidatus Saccharibacteria bacterium]|nr:VWA domain-containing protein [Candidatus Saccharibacteria bacterium]